MMMAVINRPCYLLDDKRKSKTDKHERTKHGHEAKDCSQFFTFYV